MVGAALGVGRPLGRARTTLMSDSKSTSAEIGLAAAEDEGSLGQPTALIGAPIKAPDEAKWRSASAQRSSSVAALEALQMAAMLAGSARRVISFFKKSVPLVENHFCLCRPAEHAWRCRWQLCGNCVAAVW